MLSLDTKYQEFNASTALGEWMMWRDALRLWKRTLPEVAIKLIAFQNVLWKASNYLLSQIGNADETPIYFDIPSSYSANAQAAKHALIKTDNEKMQVTVMWGVGRWHKTITICDNKSKNYA